MSSHAQLQAHWLWLPSLTVLVDPPLRQMLLQARKPQM
jgi:hypothetical protein